MNESEWEPDFISIMPECYFASPSAEPGRYNHYLFGKHQTPGAQCPNCSRPLLRFLSLDTHDPRLRFEKQVEMIPLFYCLTCGAYLKPPRRVFYQLEQGDRIRLLDYPKGQCPNDDDELLRYPQFLPGSHVELTPLSGREQAIIKLLNRAYVDGVMDEAIGHLRWKYRGLAEPRDQVGGEPYMIQTCLVGSESERDEIKCPNCGRDMPFLASIANNRGNGNALVKHIEMQVLFSYCASCCVVSVDTGNE